jgi:hypothetical protein
MNPNDLLAARISLITESVIHKDWGRAYTLIEEWESDDRLSHSPNKKHLDSIPHDGWEIADGAGIEFEELGECFN